MLNYEKVLNLLMLIKAGTVRLPDGELRVRIHGLKADDSERDLLDIWLVKMYNFQ